MIVRSHAASMIRHYLHPCLPAAIHRVQYGQADSCLELLSFFVVPFIVFHFFSLSSSTVPFFFI